MSEPTFDQLVRETSFAGQTSTDIVGLKNDVREIKSDVKHIRRQMDRWGGAVALVGAMVSAAVSFAVAMFR